MSRVAVISDIHGNQQAVETVLRAIDEERPDEVWCLGDLVGYGARPNECCELVQKRADVCLAGNHDLAVLGELDLGDFTPDAVAAALLAREMLTDESRSFLASLRPSAAADGVELFHGSARDPVWEYVLDGYSALATLELTSSELVLVGHSHVPLAISLTDELLAGGLAAGGTEHELEGARWLLNPGSVGQPRDGDPRAAWLLLDLERRHASFRRVEYPVERTQAEIREAGLPEALAARLAVGH